MACFNGHSGLLALLAAFCCVFVLVDGRFLIVGEDQDPQEPWTESNVNYSLWTEVHKLYVGDIAVFKYRPAYHLVQQLPDYPSWAACDYTNALVLGNDTAGVGAGFWVTVTDTPNYLGCGVNGHCELGQKVILNGSLGPLPANLNTPCPSNLCAPPPPGSAIPPPATTTPSPPAAPSPAEIALYQSPPPAAGSSPSPSPPPSSPSPSPSPTKGAGALAPGVLILLAAAGALLL